MQKNGILRVVGPNGSLDRREFATKMRNQMKIHAGRRRDSVKRYRLVVENHTNTADFEKLNY